MNAPTTTDAALIEEARLALQRYGRMLNSNGSLDGPGFLSVCSLIERLADALSRRGEGEHYGEETPAGGWIPIVLCPTDGTLRALLLPDGSEIAGYFDGPSNRLGATLRWKQRDVAYHNSVRIIGQRGGVDQWSVAYDTYVDSDLPEGVYPTYFRPNDTVHGAPKATVQADPDGDDNGLVIDEAVSEQPDYDYFECPECGFDSVQKTEFAGSEACPLCAGDSGHDVRMNRRTARKTDKPEGKDARPTPPETDEKDEGEQRYGDLDYEGVMADLSALLTAIIRRINGEATMESLADFIRLNYPLAAKALAASPASKMLVDADWLRRKVETDPDIDVEASPAPPTQDARSDAQWLAEEERIELAKLSPTQDARLRQYEVAMDRAVEVMQPFAHLVEAPFDDDVPPKTGDVHCLIYGGDELGDIKLQDFWAVKAIIAELRAVQGVK